MAKKWNQFEMFSSKVDNHKLSLGAAETVKYHVIPNGNDSASSPYDIYFNFEREAVAVTIRATVLCSLTELNGIVLKSPITINAGTNVIKIRCSTFKIVSIGSTVLEVTIK